MRGSLSVKVDPTPTSLSTVIDPPISSARLRDKGRPSPLLRSRRPRPVSTWTNSSKMLPRSSVAMPRPVSATDRTTSSVSGSCSAETRISPFSVNFTAFEIRFLSIWLTLYSSVTSVGTFVDSKMSRTLASMDSGRNIPRRAAKTSSTSKGTERTEILPASIFARSSRSLTKSMRSCADF